MLRAALIACVVGAAAAFAPGAATARPMQLKATSFCQQSLPQAAARPANKASLRMALEDITDTSGALGGLKWFGFFGASFVPSLFLAGYFLGGYFPGGVEPSWWPTAMQYSHGVNKGTLATNVAKVEAKAAKAAASAQYVSVPHGGLWREQTRTL